MTAETLKRQIAEAFSGAPYPGDDCIAPHECGECEEIRQSFRGQTPVTLRDEVILTHFDSLPLLTPEAFRYFIPAYIRYSVEHPDSTVAEFVLYRLAPKPFAEFDDERFRLFAPKERDTVIAFLEFLKSQPMKGDEEWQQRQRDEIDSGIETWRLLP